MDGAIRLVVFKLPLMYHRYQIVEPIWHFRVPLGTVCPIILEPFVDLCIEPCLSRLSPWNLNFSSEVMLIRRIVVAYCLLDDFVLGKSRHATLLYIFWLASFDQSTYSVCNWTIYFFLNFGKGKKISIFTLVFTFYIWSTFKHDF